MNKTQLIAALAGHFDGNKKAAQHALESVLDTVTREVTKGEKVAITGFGAFEKVIRPARMVRNPQTGDRMRAKKKAVPKFRPGADLKAVVAGDKKLPKATTTRTAARTSTARQSSTAKKSPAKKTPAKQTASKSTPAAEKAASKSASKSAAKSSSARKTATKRS
ncbi:MAG: HU family DNA-binding protein [Nocardioidaceae bacterium]